jgi:hypothetical protein
MRYELRLNGQPGDRRVHERGPPPRQRRGDGSGNRSAPLTVTVHGRQGGALGSCADALKQWARTPSHSGLTTGLLVATLRVTGPAWPRVMHVCFAAEGGQILARVGCLAHLCWSAHLARACWDQSVRPTDRVVVSRRELRPPARPRVAFHPSSGQCVLYSTLSADFTTLRQIQSGIVRCDGGPLGGSCPSGQVFVERYNGASYFCTPGYSFSNSYQYDATTFRNGPSSTTFTGQINGASLSQGGFGLSDEIRGLAWGEVAGTSTCPSSNSGSFFTWQKYDTSSGWSYVTGSDVHQYATFGFAGAPCWGTITSTSSQGAFDVDD